VELVGRGVLLRAVRLVGDHDHALRRLPQQLGDLVVLRQATGPGVHDEEHQGGVVQHLADLGPDRRRNALFRLRVEAPGVHEEYVAALDHPLRGHAVAGDARPVLDQGAPLADQPVEERALPDVRAAHDRDPREAPSGRFCHPFCLPGHDSGH